MRSVVSKIFLSSISVAVRRIMFLMAMAAMVACGSDPSNDGGDGGGSGSGNNGGGNDDYEQGVILPSSTTLSSGAGMGELQIAVTTEKGFSVEVSDNRMVEVVEGTGSASVGGRYLVKFNVMSNPTTEARSCTVLITVDGYESIELCQIKQKAGTANKVNDWIAKRLYNEYLWLDEYRTMDYRFDYTKSYSSYLDDGLKMMETNYMDGKTIVNADGSKSRQLYSYIVQESSVRSTRAGASMTTGFGINLIPVAWGDQKTGIVYFLIDHVYASSPADVAGLQRGDIIVGVDGSRINNINYANVYNQISLSSTQSVKIEKVKGAFSFDPSSFETEQISLQKGAYFESPVAYCSVLDLSKYQDLQPLHDRKIGYLTYLSFEYDYEQQLIAAIKDLQAQNVTDIIVDLRTNGGGSVSICQEFVSMILSESYIGQTVCTLSRNPRNAVASPEEINEKILVLKNDSDGNDLPNLNLTEVWFIGSYSSASASEMMIKGFEGLDVKTHLIGVPTHGKNTGMDVIMNHPIDGKYYTFAPITFFNSNAKGDSDYYNGIQPEINLKTFVTDAASEDVRSWAQFFTNVNYPRPDAVWGDFVNDLALREVLMQMMGKSMKDWQPSEAAASTRSGTAFRNLSRQNHKAMPIEVVDFKGGSQFVREHNDILMDAQ